MLGFAIFISGMIVVANIFGLITGEWRHTAWWTKAVQAVGLLFTCGAIATLALAGYFGARAAATSAPTIAPTSAPL